MIAARSVYLFAAMDRLKSLDLSDRNTALAAAGPATAAVGGLYLLRRALRASAKPKRGPLTPETLPEGAFDAVIVGAGACRRRLSDVGAPPGRPRAGFARCGRSCGL